ncbi:MAG TPA: DinB family protein [Nitrososphaeraceae archaeon]
MTENYNTAWLSLKDTLLHIIWAEDSWITYSINNFEDPNRPFDFSKYDSWEKIVDYNNRVVSKVNSYFVNLNDIDLVKTVYRINNDGVRRKSIARDVLLHVIIEELHHRGEIIAILWQDLQPPDMSWLSVMRKTDPIWYMK